MSVALPAAALVAFALTAVAQDSKPEAQRLLVRQEVVSPATLQPTGQLGLGGYVRDARWLGEQRYAVDDVSVDLAALEVLEVSGEAVLLRTASKKVLWSIDRAAAGVAFGEKLAQRRLLLGARVVLPRADGGLVGLDRATGEVRWQHLHAPSDLVIADGELVITAGRVGDKEMLAAFAVPNGARAFQCTLPAAATRLAAAPHGIAVVAAAGVTVFDRSGPTLFTAKGAVIDVVPVPLAAYRSLSFDPCWFVVTRDSLHLWNRQGDALWTQPVTVDSFTSVALAVTSTGALLELRHCPMSDSGVGVVCRDPRDGGVQWRFTDPGLGVSHSKYWHRVHACVVGDSVFVVSQAAGGNFVVELDAATGEKRQRATFDNR